MNKEIECCGYMFGGLKMRNGNLIQIPITEYYKWGSYKIVEKAKSPGSWHGDGLYKIKCQHDKESYCYKTMIDTMFEVGLLKK